MMHYNEQFRTCEKVIQRMTDLGYETNIYATRVAVRESVIELAQVIRCIIDELEERGRHL